MTATALFHFLCRSVGDGSHQLYVRRAKELLQLARVSGPGSAFMDRDRSRGVPEPFPVWTNTSTGATPGWAARIFLALEGILLGHPAELQLDLNGQPPGLGDPFQEFSPIQEDGRVLFVPLPGAHLAPDENHGVLIEELFAFLPGRL